MLFLYVFSKFIYLIIIVIGFLQFMTINEDQRRGRLWCIDIEEIFQSTLIDWLFQLHVCESVFGFLQFMAINEDQRSYQ